MLIIRNLKNLKSNEALSLTIGNFDGVHLAHQEILKKIRQKAQKNGLKSAVLTFSNHPIEFFLPQLAKNFLIANLALKLRLFKENSIDFVFVLPFDQKFSQISASDFAQKILQENLRVKELTIGHDFSFGKNREGNFTLLQNYNFNVEQVEALKDGDLTISSSMIRKFLQNGEVKKAGKFLGRDFALQGTVIHGFKKGRELGFKTANIKPRANLIQPKFGVYKSKISVPFLNQEFDAITNFGVRPTIGGSNEPLLETHIFGFEKFADEDALYGKKIVLKLLDFVREEKKFASLEELKKQIARDVEVVLGRV